MLINVAFVVAAIASIALLLYVRTASGRSAMFARGFLELTIPLALAAGIFVVLQFQLARTSATSATSTIAQIESAISEIRNTWLKELNPPAWLQFVCVMVLFIGGLIWPSVRAASMMQSYKTATQWMARSYVFATVLASFTFFGGSYLGGLAAAEAKLVTKAAEIRLIYGDLHQELGDALQRSAIAAVIDEPEIAAQAHTAEMIVSRAKREQEEIRATREETTRASAYLADFEVPEVSERPRPEPPPRERSVPDVVPSVDESGWSRARGETGRRDLAQARKAAGLDRPELTMLTESAVDAVHDHAGKALLAALIGDGTLRALLEVAIDPAVLHNFRDVVARKVNEAYREIAAGRDAKAVFTTKMVETRALVSAIAKRSANTIGAAVEEAATRWRARADAAAALHIATTRDLNAKAEAQYRRDAAAFAREWRATYRFPDAWLMATAEHVRDGALQRARAMEDPLDRVAELNNVRTRLAIAGEQRLDVDAVIRLIDFEKEHSEARPFHRALSATMNVWMMWHDFSEWGTLRNETHERSKGDSDLHAIADRWQLAKERLAIAGIIQGEPAPSALAWERAFYEHCKRDAEAAVMWGSVLQKQRSRDVNLTFVDSSADSSAEEEFRRYLEANRLGGREDASRVFSTMEATRAAARLEVVASRSTVIASPSGRSSGRTGGSTTVPKGYQPPRPPSPPRRPPVRRGR